MISLEVLIRRIVGDNVELRRGLLDQRIIAAAQTELSSITKEITGLSVDKTCLTIYVAHPARAQALHTRQREVIGVINKRLGSPLLTRLRVSVRQER